MRHGKLAKKLADRAIEWVFSFPLSFSFDS